MDDVMEDLRKWVIQRWWIGAMYRQLWKRFLEEAGAHCDGL
jgi:hypothetical protein